VVVLEHREQARGQLLERERRDLEGGRGRLVRGVEEVAPEGVGGGEGDGVEDAVDRAPAAGQLVVDRPDVVGPVDVELEDVDLAGQPPGRPRATA
jgi:hypothetical protein